jgi:predicted nucleic acid-binding protein
LILVDAGPLVAIVHRSDAFHEPCAEVFRSLKRPPLVVWPAVTEAMHLLNFSWKAQDALWELLENGSVLLAHLIPADIPRMRKLVGQYRDLPMDLADAALVCVAEREKISRVFTLDRKDFRIYRPRGLGRFSILPS